MSKSNLFKSIGYIVLLILAAEAVFILPFVLQRVFRPTVLETFAINNENLGYCFSVYGIVALWSYLFGGPIADRFQPKNLMALALILTALGGLYFATYPNYSYLKLLYGYWGFTTIFLFWSPMVKATRLWGGDKQQGMAFGFLDGGRGLVAAGFGSIGVLVFSLVLKEDVSLLDLSEKQKAFKLVILISSALVAFIGILVFFFLKTTVSLSTSSTISEVTKLNIKGIKAVLKQPAVWLLMLIILCAYTAYKATDLFSLYANRVMLYNEIDSAKVGTNLLYIRPIIGVVIGLLADRSKPSIWLIIGFILTIIASLVFGTDLVNSKEEMLFIITILIMGIGVYSCRVLYFATLEESKIPVELTGTAVGIASIIGFTPDIFSGPMFGILVDHPDPVIGLQNAFKVLILFSGVGLIASTLLYALTKKRVLIP